MTQEYPNPAKLFADATKSFQELSGQNLSAFNAFMPPLAQATAKFSLELMRFAARRAVECSELPDKLGKCQSAPEMFRQQMSFLEAQRQQYTEEWFRLMEIATDTSWLTYRAETAAPVETLPGWGAMAAWLPQAQTQQRREDQPAVQPGGQGGSRAAAE